MIMDIDDFSIDNASPEAIQLAADVADSVFKHTNNSLTAITTLGMALNLIISYMTKDLPMTRRKELHRLFMAQFLATHFDHIQVVIEKPVGNA